MYDYKNEKPKIFSEKGQIKFLKIRDTIKAKCILAGVCDMESAIRSIGGDTWESMACVDRLVELEEIIEVQLAKVPIGQHRIFRNNE